MSSFIYSLLEVNVLIVLLFASVMLVRRWLTYRQQSRSIIAIPIISGLVVFLKSILDVSSYGISIPVIEVDPVIVSEMSSAVVQETSVSIDWIFYVYLLPVLSFVFFIGYKMVKLIRFFMLNNANVIDGYHIYSVKGEGSFSFFNRIQIAPNLEANQREIVLEHEKLHANKLHSLDVVILEVCHALFWFNPMFILMKRELTSLHEFEVDALMFKKHKVNYMKFLLDYAFGSSSNYLLISRFYNRLTIKKRIKIMKTKTKTKSLFLAIIPMIALVFGSVQCTKDSSDDDVKVEIPEVVYDDVELYPEFVGGEEAMVTYLAGECKYPQSAIDDGVTGIVYVEFVVAKNGQIKDAKVKRSVHPDLDKEALRVVSDMPAWTPGKKDGVNVAVKYTIPINFQLG